MMMMIDVTNDTIGTIKASNRLQTVPSRDMSTRRMPLRADYICPASAVDGNQMYEHMRGTADTK